MFAFLLPLASKVITDAVAKIPENEELGEQLIKICIVILQKAVKLTKTDMDDRLLEKLSSNRSTMTSLETKTMVSFFYKYLYTRL